MRRKRDRKRWLTENQANLRSEIHGGNALWRWRLVWTVGRVLILAADRKMRDNVTKEAQSIAKSVPQTVKRQLEVLHGPLPDVAPGDHCRDPYDCPFMARCAPPLPAHHVSTLYKITRKKLRGLLQAGHESLRDLPEDFTAKGAAQRQIESVRTGAPVIAPGLKQALLALSAVEGPIAFLDFETIMPAVPVWPGCHPYQQIPVQFSCHVLTESGIIHHQWLADGPSDPRETFAQALIAACQGTKTIVAYSASFEQRCISIVRAGRAPPLDRALAKPDPPYAPTFSSTANATPSRWCGCINDCWKWRGRRNNPNRVRF